VLRSVTAFCCLIATSLLAGQVGSEPEPASPEPQGSLTVLITGANRGLGLEFARQFQAAGAEVIGTARRPDEARELRALGVRVEQLDVTDAESVARLGAHLEGQRLDILSRSRPSTSMPPSGCGRSTAWVRCG
jgi:NADPH:quinone reductase-like Zn-dependent oxidoreductase